MAEEIRLQKPRLDAMRAQMRSAPASLHVSSQEIHSMHSHSNENARTSRSIIGISKTSTLRPKLNALKAIRDASSRPYDWQDLAMRKPSELPRADALRGSVNNTRGALYSLPCNSQTINLTPRTPRIPSKLDALRQQMASAPASRAGPGNLHSFCYDYLYKKEGSHRRTKLDEKSLRTIDKRLDVADSSLTGHGSSTFRSVRSCPDSSCNCDKELRSRTHRRRSSSKMDATGATLGTAPAACTLASRDNIEEFHPKNYRLRSDMDALRRTQQSAPSSILCTESRSNCPCQEAEENHRHSKKSVNFRDHSKDDLLSRYDSQLHDLQPKHYRSRQLKEGNGPGPSLRSTLKCEPSCNCEDIKSYQLRKTAGHGSSHAENRYREDPKLYSEDLVALSEELEASQVRCERLDKSLQRQKMMLRLIRRNKERFQVLDR